MRIRVFVTIIPGRRDGAEEGPYGACQQNLQNTLQKAVTTINIDR